MIAFDKRKKVPGACFQGFMCSYPGIAAQESPGLRAAFLGSCQVSTVPYASHGHSNISLVSELLAQAYQARLCLFFGLLGMTRGYKKGQLHSAGWESGLGCQP